MGAGASSASTSGVKAAVAASTSDDLKATFATLTPADRAKMMEALSAPTAAVPERAAKLMQHRTIWSSNRAAFDGWIGKTVEAALEPDLEIVDPHHHLWDMRELKGFNLFGFMRQQYYLTDELIDDCIGGGHNVTHTVFVTTHAFFAEKADPPWMAPLGEVQFVQGVAAQVCGQRSQCGQRSSSVASAVVWPA
jgi:hypothetical protein